MNALLDQLHDIDGLDAVSFWPLARGWWVVIGLSFILLAALLCYGLYRLAFLRSWKNDTLKKLAQLEKNLSTATAKDSAIILSEYLRRIALRRFSRKECAALMGEAWLSWLTEHDPKAFDWKTKGAFLINLPYAPQDTTVAVEQVKDLIQATKFWVK